MKQKYIDRLISGRTAGEDFMYFLRKLPDELDVYLALQDIFDNTEENGADWATRQFQQIAKQYLSDDADFMRLINEDEKNSSARQ